MLLILRIKNTIKAYNQIKNAPSIRPKASSIGDAKLNPNRLFSPLNSQYDKKTINASPI